MISLQLAQAHAYAAAVRKIAAKLGVVKMGEVAREPAAKSMWSKLILSGSVIGAALLPIGAVGTRLGLWEFTIGFLFLLIGSIIH